MKYLIAYRVEHAYYYARQVLRLQKSLYRIVMKPEALRGLRNVEIYIIDAPRFRPNDRELDDRVYMGHILLGLTNVTIRRVKLP